MRFFIAFNVEPLQLKFLNWVLGRTDIDKEKLVEAIRSNNEDVRDAVVNFSKFQNEVKRYANMLGNKSKDFQECIYNKCVDDDTFEYVFGKSNNKTEYVKNYEHIVNTIYDAFYNSIEFSNKGKFKERAKKVYDGFTSKETTNETKLENLVQDMDGILADNSKGKNLNKTFNVTEEESWKKLESNEQYHKGKWHIYLVDSYEDMKNVAGECSSWCVARENSGEDYFYTYKPSYYYLFCKGERNPFVLMHIGSEQFKGLDDFKFNADRPSSYEAIKIGKEFLEHINALDTPYDESKDFSVFNDDETFDNVPSLNDKITIATASDDELDKMLDTVDDNETLVEIARSAETSSVILKALNKIDKKEYLEHAISSVRGNLSHMDENTQKIMCSWMFEFYESKGDTDSKNTLLNNISNENVISYVVSKYFSNDELFSMFSDSRILFFSKELMSYVFDKDRKDWIKAIFCKTISDSLENYIAKRYADDEDIMFAKIEFLKNGRKDMSPYPRMSKIAECTNNPNILKKIADCVLNDMSSGHHAIGVIIAELLKKLDDKDYLKKVFDSLELTHSWIEHDDNLARIGLSKSTNLYQQSKSLQLCKSVDLINEFFDKNIDKLGNGKIGGGEFEHQVDEHGLFLMFATKLEDSERIHKFLEKTEYDIEMMCNLKHIELAPMEDCVKCAEKADSVENMSMASLLSRVMYDKGMDDSEISHNYCRLVLDKDKSPILSSWLLMKKTKDPAFMYELIKKYGVWDAMDVTLHLEKHPEFQTTDIIREVGLSLLHYNNYEGLKKLIKMDNCPVDTVKGFLNALPNKNTIFGEECILALFKRNALEDPTEFLKFLKDDKFCGIKFDEIMMACKGNQTNFKMMFDAVADQPKKSLYFAESAIRNEDKLGVDLSSLVDYCIQEGGTCLKYALCSKYITEQQILDIAKISYNNNSTVMDDAMEYMPPRNLKIVEKLENEGKLSDVDWTLLALKENPTEEDLKKAVEKVEKSEWDNTRVIRNILHSKNCTQEIANRAIDCLDYDNFYNDEDSFELLYKWSGAKVIRDERNKHGHRLDDFFELFKAPNAELDKIANCCHTERDFEEVLSRITFKSDDDFENEDDDDSPDRYDDELDKDGSDDEVVVTIVKKPECTFDFLLHVIEVLKDKGKRDLINSVISDYIKSHNSMPTDEIARCFDTFQDAFAQHKWVVEGILECTNATEEQLLTVLNTYHTFGDMDKVMANPAITERVLFEMMDVIGDDVQMSKIAKSDNANEAVLEKIVDYNLGNISLKEVKSHTRNEELKQRIDKILAEDRNSSECGIIGKVNREKNYEALKELIVKLYQQLINKRFENDYDEPKIFDIKNPAALELLSHTKRNYILANVAINPNASERTVMSILKKNQTRDLMSSVSKDCHIKEAIIYVASFTNSDDDIRNIMQSKENMTQLDANDILKLIARNDSVKYSILKYGYYKLSTEQIESLRKYKDEDMDWLIDYLTGSRKRVNDGTKAGRIVERILEAGKIDKKPWF